MQLAQNCNRQPARAVSDRKIGSMPKDTWMAADAKDQLLSPGTASREPMPKDVSDVVRNGRCRDSHELLRHARTA